MDDARATTGGSRATTGGWRATVAGLLAGALGFVAVLAVTALRQRDRAADTADFVDALAVAFGPGAGSVLSGIADWLEPDPAQVVAWFAYASHRVPLDVDAEAFGNAVHRSVDVQSLSVWDGALAYLPPVVLFGAGAAVVALAEVDRLSRAWQPGLAVAAGYVAAAVLTLRVATYERSLGVASVTVGPDPVTVALHTTAYALVFGLAGALAVAVAQSQVGEA
jgi:hypothetical protein